MFILVTEGQYNDKAELLADRPQSGFEVMNYWSRRCIDASNHEGLEVRTEGDTTIVRSAAFGTEAPRLINGAREFQARGVKIDGVYVQPIPDHERPPGIVARQ